MFLEYVWAFLIGGAFCAVGQLLIDLTKLTPARILVSYVVAGVVLGAVGVYDPLIEFAGGGATVPLTGFGNLLAKGVREAVTSTASSELSWEASPLRRLVSRRRCSSDCSRLCALRAVQR